MWYLFLIGICYYGYQQYKTNDYHITYDELKKIEHEMMQFDKLYPLCLMKKDIIETEVNKENKMVEEETPEGYVKMAYDDFTKSFFYWSKKSIAYKYLNTLARKYVILYECKELYIDKHTLENPEKVEKSVIKKKIVKPVLTNGNIFKWIGKEYVKEEKKKEEIKSISYAEFIKIKNIK
jgi:hypothetical protein